ncbi:hypothetical protein G7046_g3274 [Stylonectria norvegica]|nr:hypothetical protein G7046_g3274 [Stylonectria norvegica]
MDKPAPSDEASEKFAIKLIDRLEAKLKEPSPQKPCCGIKTNGEPCEMLSVKKDTKEAGMNTRRLLDLLRLRQYNSAYLDTSRILEGIADLALKTHCWHHVKDMVSHIRVWFSRPTRLELEDTVDGNPDNEIFGDKRSGGVVLGGKSKAWLMTNRNATLETRSGSKGNQVDEVPQLDEDEDEDDLPIRAATKYNTRPPEIGPQTPSRPPRSARLSSKLHSGSQRDMQVESPGNSDASSIMSRSSESVFDGNTSTPMTPPTPPSPYTPFTQASSRKYEQNVSPTPRISGSNPKPSTPRRPQAGRNEVQHTKGQRIGGEQTESRQTEGRQPVGQQTENPRNEAVQDKPAEEAKRPATPVAPTPQTKAARTPKPITPAKPHAKFQIAETLYRDFGKQDSKHGIVYILTSSQLGLVKIGWTEKENVWKRYSGTPCKLQDTAKLVAVSRGHFFGARRVEALVHRDLQKQRRPFQCSHCPTRHREWFEVEVDVAIKSFETWSRFVLHQDSYGHTAKGLLTDKAKEVLDSLWTSKMIVDRLEGGVGTPGGNNVERFDNDGLSRLDWKNIQHPNLPRQLILQTQTQAVQQSDMVKEEPKIIAVIEDLKVAEIAKAVDRLRLAEQDAQAAESEKEADRESQLTNTTNGAKKSWRRLLVAVGRKLKAKVDEEDKDQRPRFHEHGKGKGKGVGGDTPGPRHDPTKSQSDLATSSARGRSTGIPTRAKTPPFPTPRRPTSKRTSGIDAGTPGLLGSSLCFLVDSLILDFPLLTRPAQVVGQQSTRSSSTQNTQTNKHQSQITYEQATAGQQQAPRPSTRSIISPSPPPQLASRHQPAVDGYPAAGNDTNLGSYQSIETNWTEVGRPCFCFAIPTWHDTSPGFLGHFNQSSRSICDGFAPAQLSSSRRLDEYLPPSKLLSIPPIYLALLPQDHHREPTNLRHHVDGPVLPAWRLSCFILVHQLSSYACMRPSPRSFVWPPADRYPRAGHSTGPGQSSAGLTINLSSNNPFRNRAPSPANADALLPPKPDSPFDDPPARPLSRNPFLDAPPPVRSPSAMSNQSDHKSLSAEQIFDSLTLDEKPTNSRPPTNPPPAAPRRPMDRQPGPRRTDKPLPTTGGSHRPTRSQEEALRARRLQSGGTRPGPSESPQRKPTRRVRRNSESSLMDLDAKPITAEERKMIEDKRRESERKRREGRDARDGREGKKDSKSGRPSRRMDIIDQLDATSIYGMGVFHHDGPFDALNPHRNRGGSRRAPMQAFPKDSLNNSLGGSGPLNKEPDHSTFMGNGTDEAFREFSKGVKPDKPYFSSSRIDGPIFDPHGRSEIVHGEETHGLGTSTFLEGTPVPKSVIARRQAEQAQDNFEGGLQRKKSLAQRIRHINKGPRGFDSSGRMTNPEGAYNRISPEGAPSAASNLSDNNPFFSEFSKGEENINVRRRDGARPRQHLHGVLGRQCTRAKSRMKSLKGGRRPRNDGGDDDWDDGKADDMSILQASVPGRDQENMVPKDMGKGAGSNLLRQDTEHFGCQDSKTTERGFGNLTSGESQVSHPRGVLEELA